ncbi:Type I restriction-modification system, M subunit [Streptomyces albus]|uniref:site-specific DNA-methyltransferase (adenine-specific) n=1 Tax=Streptomyces albus (strain ATCC 21838 / DSM 41398 / FERM P-419 / JCM 4703 / NBRC 107858) TaxID=1081613 RepID=A0A0B5ER69_STRA4|nr:Type I restriction-modification system, M subunit [Streptomyces albus]AOU78409.1 Type I restriction-modification system, M subunit [Streptomyces albus]AYN34158.1 type I restriction enzyme M protein [Streptomyces albus]
MTLYTVSQLEKDLFAAADILRGRMDASQYREVLSAMLLLKRVSDQPGILQVPDRARWSQIVGYVGKAPGRVLNEALWELEKSNPETLKGVFEAVDFDVRLSRGEAKSLIDHFDRIPLANDDLDFGDTVGRAYDYLLGAFADSAGKRGGEFFTPRSVVQLMVRLVRPREGQSVYDPFAGSGGMLVQAGQYVDEQGGEGSDLALFGQEKNAATCATARLNLLLHGFTDCSVLCGDTLSDPLHSLEDGYLRRFDRVLTNPPFSMNYSEKEMKHTERMKYGWAPEQGKKADLMNVQHVLATLRPDGIGAVVTPHGVLFRGGAEKQIRQGIVEDGRLEAVIGIGPNVFHGTAIPACILVLRGADATAADQRGQVLFINAEREVVTGRSQNRLEPQNVEKIVGVFREWADIPGFSRVVPQAKIADNDFNLNIGLYVDAGPPAEPPLDVRAALFGGVPRREVEDKIKKFQVFGIGLTDLFETRDLTYLDFPSDGYEATAARIPAFAAARERDFIDRCHSWWWGAESRIAELAGTHRLLMLRSRLMSSFCEELLPTEILDRYQLTGVFAAWWADRRDDLRALDLQGFPGVIERWAVSGSRPPHLPASTAGPRVLISFGHDLSSRVEKLVASERQGLVDLYRSWGDRYGNSFTDLERQSEAAAERLRARLRELGYT